MIKKLRKRKIKTITPLIPTALEKQLPFSFSANVHFNPYILGYCLAILSALCILVMSLLGKLGYALSGVEVHQQMLPWYSLSWNGIIIGMAEAALGGLVLGFLFGWLYNKLS